MPANHKRSYRQKLKIGVGGEQHDETNIEIYLADASLAHA